MDAVIKPRTFNFDGHEFLDFDRLSMMMALYLAKKAREGDQDAIELMKGVVIYDTNGEVYYQS